LSESWFSLGRADQAEALEVAAGRTGRPAHLLEKDIWVVWALSAIYGSQLAEKLTFKGGTSLSKVYKIIDRFSEDIDLTYDIRDVGPRLVAGRQSDSCFGKSGKENHKRRSGTIAGMDRRLGQAGS
jgi:predicted nucleotidyltransferase component of viral defense system